MHILVEDAVPTFRALAAAGITVASEQEVIVAAIGDHPGALGETTRRLGDAGVNISSGYLATRTRLVLAADDLAKAKACLGQRRTVSGSR